MPNRTIQVNGRTWDVFPSGRVTQYDRDEFALVFVSGDGDARQQRVSRYSPQGARSREQSLAEMSDAEIARLFEYSQSGDTSPEVGYRG